MDAIVIGAGPAGLAVATCLKADGLRPLVLERADAVASAWRRHYEGLRLHTTRARSGLPGRPMPSDYPQFPTRDQVIDYLEDYAVAEDLDIRFGAEVTHVAPVAGGWSVEATGGRVEAPVVVFATGLNGTARVPSWPGEETFPGRVLHSSVYRTPGDFAGQRVLVVGFGNSGGDIALELARAGLRPDVAVRGPVALLPLRIFGLPTTSLGLLPRLVGARAADRITAPVIRMILGRAEDYGLRASEKGPVATVVEDGRVPLIDHGALAEIRAGRIGVRPGPERFEGAEVVFSDGGRGTYDAVILATGYVVDLRPILGASEALDDAGRPRVSGAASGAGGLYFCSYRASPSGQLRQICVEAAAIARDARGYLSGAA